LGKGKEGVFKKVWNFFTSVKLTILLLIILAITSISGTLIVQRGRPREYIKTFGETGYTVIKALGLMDAYHSWWFLALLVILAVNLIVCSLDRFPKSWQYVKEPLRWPSPDTLKEMSPNTIIKTDLPLEEIVNKTAVAMKSNGYPGESKLDSNRAYIFAQKGLINRLGVYITHLSILTILIGGLTGGIWGFSGSMTIVGGEASRNVVLFGSNRVITLPFDVRCDAFQVTYYPNTMTPKEYKSALTIVENGKPVLSKSIRVNHPLKYRGVSFYQASYGTVSNEEGVLTLKVKPQDGGEPFKISVKVGNEASLDKDYKVKVVAFFPDLVLGEGNQPMNRSNELRNPAALLEIEKNGKFAYRSWVFAFFPGIHSIENVPFKFKYISFKGLQYTGLQVSKDPGVLVVWLGCTLMVLGLVVCFFLSHRRVWVFIEDKGNKRHILMAGNTNRNQATFTQHFEDLVTSVKEALSTPA